MNSAVSIEMGRSEQIMIGDWQDKQVVIVGAARQGLALARYLLEHGAKVIVNDRRALAELAEAQAALADLGAGSDRLHWAAGGHPLDLLEGVDLVCLSGGVTPMLPLIQAARQRGIPLSNDSQIFLEAAPCRVIGITGSAGKTTTTTLVGRIAAAAAGLAQKGDLWQAWVGGNIGSPLIAFVDRMGSADLAVMELSSFQLEIMQTSPDIAAILNLTPNHLDRHGTMDAYTQAKARILDFQSSSDTAVLGRDDPGAWALAERVQGRILSFGFSELPADQPGVSLVGDGVYLQRAPGATAERVLNIPEVELRGLHNLLNVMAACAIAAAADLPVEAMRAGVQGFRGVAHRLEFVRRWRGADWYNDSIATAPERSMAAIRSFDEPLILLAGGRDKQLPWDDFAALALRRVDHLILFGEAAGIIQSALERASGAPLELTEAEAVAPASVGTAGSAGLRTVTRCGSLQQAVRAAAGLVNPGDVVLLSPGGTSFDEFRDFEERGKWYAQWVRELI